MRTWTARLERMLRRAFALIAAFALFGGIPTQIDWPRLVRAAEPNLFRAGAAISDVSPTNFPVIVNGMFTERAASKVVDPLCARAVVLDDGSTRLAIAVVDTCMMPRSLIDTAKARASEATGIPAQRMLISATHTHSAPAAMGCLGSRADTNYAAFLPGKIAEAIVEANRRLAPARIGWGVVEDWEHTFNRRWIRRPDRMLDDPFGERSVRAHMHPGHQSADVVGPSGPVDPALSLIAIEHRDGKALALLANYSQHYYDSPLLSSDYFGRFALHIAALLGATNANDRFVGIMSQGTSGDLMWMDYGAPRQQIGYDAYAREVAQKAHAAYRALRFRDWVPLRMAERKLALSCRAPAPARLEWARRVAVTVGERLPKTLPEIYALEAIYLHERPATELVLQAVGIGELGIAALPNEVYALTGLKLKAQSPLQPTVNIELANGAEGYIPPPEQHELGGYTTWPARTAGLEVQAEPKIVETLLSLLEEVAGQPRRSIAIAHGPYAEAVLAAKPIAYWRFEEMVIPRALDSTANEHHARYENGIALYLPGVGSGDGVSPSPQLTGSRFSGASGINRAAHFAGGRARARLPGLGRSYSIELWCWNGLDPAARGVTGHLAAVGEDGKLASAEILGITGTESPDATGRLFFSAGHPSNAPLTGQTVIELRTWHHVVLVRDGSKVAVYLNGQTDPEILGEAPASSGEFPQELFIGGRTDPVATFEGKLDEVAVYNRALSREEIEHHYRAAGVSKD